MKLKTIFLLIFLTLIFSFTGIKASPLAYSHSPAAVLAKAACDEYIRVRVLVEERWWIFVYTQMGSLVCVYPDEDE